VKTIKYILYYTTIPSRINTLKLKKKANTAYTVNHLVDLAFNYSFPPLRKLSIKPAQVREEIIKLLQLLTKLKPKALLEIGTAEGGTLFLFTRVAVVYGVVKVGCKYGKGLINLDTI
jgi:cephalosporin hydroxylase